MSASSILRRPFFWVCATLGLLASCITDLADESGLSGTAQGERREVTIKLGIPAAALPQTKAGTETETNPETAVNDLIVIAFQSNESATRVNNELPDEPYLYYTVATPETGAAGNNVNVSWRANLKVTTNAQTFVIIANTKENYTKDEAKDTIISVYDRLTTLLDNAVSALPDGTGSEAQARTASTKMQLLDEITALAVSDGKISPAGPFLMSGQSGSHLIEPGTATLTMNATLLRMVARVNVTIGSTGNGITDFEPRTIHVYNTPTSGNVVPEGLTAGLNQVTGPNIPTEAAETTAPPLEYTFEEGSQALTQAIYLFEAANETETERAKRPCIVLGGLWNGKLQYWRLDFQNDSEYFPILRNYSYNFTVISIKGEGASSPELAFQSPTSAVSVDKVMWNNGNIGNIDLSGGTFIGIGTVKFQAGRLGTIINSGSPSPEHSPLTQTIVATDGAKWTASLDQDWVRFKENGDAYNISDDGKTVWGTGKDMQGNIELKFTVEPIGDDVENRTAVMTFTLNGATRNLTAEIYQDHSNPVFIEWNGNPIEYRANGTLKIGQSFRFGPENVKLSWKITRGGLGTISGTTSGEMETTATSAAGILDFGLNIVDEGGFTVGLVSGDGFFTNVGRLTLIAEKTDGTAGTATITVPIKQVKYGIKITKDDRYFVSPQAKTIQIKVQSNYQWTCKGWYPATDDDKTYLDKWLVSSNIDDGLTGQNSTIQFSLGADKTLDVIKSAKAYFEFSGNPDDETVVKDSLIITKALRVPYGGNLNDPTLAYYYAIYKKDMSFSDYIYYNYEKSVWQKVLINGKEYDAQIVDQWNGTKYIHTYVEKACNFLETTENIFGSYAQKNYFSLPNSVVNYSKTKITATLNGWYYHKSNSYNPITFPFIKISFDPNQFSQSVEYIEISAQDLSITIKSSDRQFDYFYYKDRYQYGLGKSIKVGETKTLNYTLNQYSDGWLGLNSLSVDVTKLNDPNLSVIGYEELHFGN